MRFESPWFLLLLIPIAIAYWWRQRQHLESTVRFSDIQRLKNLHDQRAIWMSRIGLWLRTAILILMVIALARPQEVGVQRESSTEGVDIVLAIDVSDSMRATDFKPNRLEVAKEQMTEFIKSRKTDRMALVVFGTDAYAVSPLSLDHNVLLNFVQKIQLGMAGDGTAIGMAIASGLNRLKPSDAKSKVIVLLTDGENNSGAIDPISAAELAVDMGVKIYTIGIGTKRGVVVTRPDGNRYLAKLEEGTLKRIAAVSSGTYFHANNEHALKSIYEQINQLERTEIKVANYFTYHDYFVTLLWIILGLFLLEIVVTNLILIVVP